MKKPKLDLKYILVESFFIVLTVTLALLLSQWRENVKEENKKREILSNIKSELVENTKTLETAMGYHKEMSESIRGFLSSDSAEVYLQGRDALAVMMTLLDRGLSPPILQNAAWRSAEITGITSSFEFETVYELSALYDLQESGVTSTWKMLASVFSDINSYREEEARNVVRLFASGIYELYQQESYLLYLTDEAIKHLEALED